MNCCEQPQLACGIGIDHENPTPVIGTDHVDNMPEIGTKIGTDHVDNMPESGTEINNGVDQIPKLISKRKDPAGNGRGLHGRVAGMCTMAAQAINTPSERRAGSAVPKADGQKVSAGACAGPWVDPVPRSLGITKTNQPWWQRRAVTECVVAKTSPAELVSRLESLKEKAIELAREPIQELDLNNMSNTIIPEKEWRPIYAPFAAELEALCKHLREHMGLKYPCYNKLKGIAKTGLNKMNRQYKHLTDDVACTHRGHDKILTLNTAEMRQSGLHILETLHPRVFLCEGPIPAYMISFHLSKSINDEIPDAVTTDTHATRPQDPSASHT